MDHLDFIILFISFSIWVAALFTSLFIRQTKLNRVAVEFRLFSTPFAILILLELLFYYLDNVISPDYSKWVSIVYWNFFQLLVAISAYKSFFLSLAISGRTVDGHFRKLFMILMSSLLFISLLLNQIGEFYSLSALVSVLPLTLLFLTGFGGGVIVQFRSINSQERKDSAVVYGILNLIIILVFIEDFITSFFDNIILHPYAFLLLNLFFIRLFGLELKRIKPAPELEINLANTASRFEISQRELDVLRLLLKGKGRSSIGEELYISPNTVKTHISNIYKKTGVTSRIELLDLLNNSM